MDIQSLFGVRGKVVLVTGGSRGIGLMIADGFVQNGAKVYISSRNAKSCEEASKMLTAKGPGTCHSLPADMQKTEDILRLVEQLKACEPNGINVLVNNAGATWGEPLETFPMTAFHKVMNLNVINVFYLTQQLLPLLEKKASKGDPSRVINIGSVAGERNSDAPTFSYAASKAALHHLTRTLSVFMGPRNITVNVVAPGPFPSKMMDETLRKNKESILGRIPLGRIGEPEDMAGACIYLSSKAGAYTNGAVLVVAGG
ncbi:hypothetical protein BB558_001572 [Smittium angustum]|uniref:Rhamnolipids biosynthesis 3-oxoacyl-[acyl-carrier-protein] reductase n=1 Tax=Smittium angustum TaxID=133377 RepID=A0A2U1JBB4_SMIAN|nr:hypothetical protein BB558_001572 [Smittium angustum]